MRKISAIVVISVLASAAVANGQGADVVPSLAPSKVNADRLRWVQYKMVAGRIVATSSYPGTNMTFGPAQVDGRRRERFEIHINQSQIDLQFELAADDERLDIVLGEGRVFTIRRERPQAKYTLEFEQIAGRPLQMTLTEAGERRTVIGDSFWHLYLAEPDLVRRHLLRFLEILHPSWQLAATGAAIEEALFERAQHPRPLDMQRWRAWIDDLASPKFSTRAAAERALENAGQVILPFLQNLDQAQLDAEQTSRVRALVESLSVGYEDSTDRIATWLAGDEQVWLSLLAREDGTRRRVAAAQLGRLLEEPIDFDPDAPEARRKLQIERLRVRLRKRAAAEQLGQ